MIKRAMVLALALLAGGCEMSQADMATLGAQMQSGSYQFQQQQQQYLQQSTSFQPGQVTPITQSGGNQVRCISAGIYTNCRY
jgi:hypothetical protein